MVHTCLMCTHLASCIYVYIHTYIYKYKTETCTNIFLFISTRLNKMKFTLFVVAFIAVTTVAHGANLRRAETSLSVSAQKKMDEFMMLYGDEIQASPEYKKHPVEYLSKFVQDTKVKIQHEQNELAEDAAKECTGDAEKTVAVSDESKWEQKTLSGCTAKSQCGERATTVTAKGTEQSTCMFDTSNVIEKENAVLDKAKATHSKASKDMKKTQARRKDAHAKYLLNLKNHNDALKVLQTIMAMLNKNMENTEEPIFLEQKQKEALRRVSVVAPILAFLEAPVDDSGSERVRKLAKMCKTFETYLKDSTEALKEKENVQVEEYDEDMGELESTMSEEAKTMAECEGKLKAAQASNNKCSNDYAKAGHHFQKSVEVCVKSHQLFKRQYEDNKQLFKLMHEVFKIVKNRLTGTVKTTITEAVRNSETGASATGGASTGSATGASATGGASTGASTDSATGVQADKAPKEEPKNSETGAELQTPTAASGAGKPEPVNEEVKGKWAAYWKQMLKMYDNDGDRRVTYQEVGAAQGKPTISQWREIAGDDGKLSFNEYSKYMDRMEQQAKKKKSTVIESQVKIAFRSALKRYDDNKDMHISYEEVVSKLPKGAKVHPSFTAQWRKAAGSDMKLSYNEYFAMVKEQASKGQQVTLL